MKSLHKSTTLSTHAQFEYTIHNTQYTIHNTQYTIININRNRNKHECDSFVFAFVVIRVLINANSCVTISRQMEMNRDGKCDWIWEPLARTQPIDDELDDENSQVQSAAFNCMLICH